MGVDVGVGVIFVESITKQSHNTLTAHRAERRGGQSTLRTRFRVVGCCASCVRMWLPISRRRLSFYDGCMPMSRHVPTPRQTHWQPITDRY